MPRHAPKWLSISPICGISLAFALVLMEMGAVSAQLPDVLGDFSSANQPKTTELKVETTLTADRLEAGAVATLSVKVTIPRGFYLYSMDPSFSRPTKITLVETPGLEPLGEFTPDHAPKRAYDEIFQKDLEKFSGQVTWTRPMRIVDPAGAAMSGTLEAIYCSTGVGGNCISSEQQITASLIQRTAPTATSNLQYEIVETPTRMDGKAGPATTRVSLSPQNAAPGENVTLTVAMTLEEGWHTYSVTQPDVPGAQATQIQLDKAQGLTPIGESFAADNAPKIVPLEGSDGSVMLEEHFGTVVWSRQFRVDAAEYGIAGQMQYVTCRDGVCLRPRTISFALGNLEGAGEVPAPLPATTSGSGPGLFSLAGADTANLPYYLALAFLGGFILNFMPCVLPVVAIKVMGFVQHAGQRRGHIFALNAAYAIGVISVFLLLATVAALPQLFVGLSEIAGVDLLGALGLADGALTWGGLFQSPAFTAGMIVLVFVMGLSLLGVYEIPIPGMVGSAAGSARHEGLTGALMMGVFTTLLATPCTGPFLTTTLGWSLQQPVTITYSIWAVMGLGMASPYLVFGLVPGAVKLLPRPGNWMVTLKQFAGFVLMGTVLWLMRSLQADFLIPLMLALLGIAMGCWMFGLVQFSTTPGKRSVVSVAAVAMAGATAYFSYGLTQQSEHELAWQPFSTARVNELIAEDKTVLIDFTADWCANCKVNEFIALNTEETKTLVEEHGVVALLADVDVTADADQWLGRFGAVGIPLTVIFPAGNPDEPIVLDGVYSQSTLIESLEKAVRPSAESTPTAAVTPATTTR